MSKIITQEEFIEKVKAVHGDDYQILSEYKGWHGKVKVRHKCGHEYEIKASSLYKKTDCRLCSESVKEGHKKVAQKRSNGLEKFKQKVYELVGCEYTVLSNVYVNNKTHVDMRHNTCGHEYPVRPNDFTSGGRRCPKCAQGKRLNALAPVNNLRKKENYLENLIINETEYQWLERYKGDNKLYHKIKHITCGHEYSVRPNDFQQGYRCPICNTRQKSKAVKYIEKLLDHSGISYIVEYKFDGCRNKMKLPFDFLVKDFIIEYDGKQHFEFNNYAIFTKEKYLDTKRNDQIKNKYMLGQEDYKFIRIHYKLKVSEIKEIIQAIVEGNFDLSLAFKYNLYYSDRDNTLNKKSYYENINKNYFTEEV